MGHGNVSVADPDLQIRREGGGHPDPEIGGGGRGGLKIEFFLAPGPSPGSATVYNNEFETKENKM